MNIDWFFVSYLFVSALFMAVIWAQDRQITDMRRDLRDLIQMNGDLLLRLLRCERLRLEGEKNGMENGGQDAPARSEDDGD